MVIRTVERTAQTRHCTATENQRAPLHDQNRIATIFSTCRTILSMISFRSSIAKRHSFPAAESARVSDRRQTVGSTIARRGKLGCVLAVPKSLKKLCLWLNQRMGAAEPALL